MTAQALTTSRPCAEAHGYTARTPGIHRFAGIEQNILSAAKRYFLAGGRLAVPFKAWPHSKSNSSSARQEKPGRRSRASNVSSGPKLAVLKGEV